MSWIQTHSGRSFDLLQPHADAIDIEDIAHALSNICRFTGHTDEFYSVAQHSVIVSRIVPPELALVGLLHDAPEAYVGDVSRPLKIVLPEYQLIERDVWRVIAAKFGLLEKIPQAVKAADEIALMSERRDLLRTPGPRWDEALEIVPRIPDLIVAEIPSVARDRFLRRFIELTSTTSLAA